MFADIAATSATVAATSKRTEKIAALADLLRRAEPQQVRAIVGFLTGAPRQGRIGVGWATLSAVERAHATTPSLTVADVDAALDVLAATSGVASQRRRADLLASLFGRATEAEGNMLFHLLTGELRQGALDGVMADAVASAAGVPAATLRRAAMLSGDLGEAAAIALSAPTGAAAAEQLATVGLRVGVFVQPMLASPAASLDDALGGLEAVSVEWKLDGARIQVHRDLDGHVAIYTRNGNEIGDRLPGIVDAVQGFPHAPFVLDGEAIGVGDDGTPGKFQDTMSRFSTDMARIDPQAGHLLAFFFDVLHADGHDLIDEPLSARHEMLDRITGAWAIPRTTDRAAAQAFADDALARRHEGVMVKDLGSRYEAGRRGSSWRKVKPVRTLDLVVLAAEWGHGRRTGWLSNLHLGARGPDGDFVMVGKTFKGLTDDLLRWQTERFQELAVRSDQGTVYLRPELVVEIALDGVQRSPRYPGGVALRFARVRGYRPDKNPEDADTIETVQSMLA